jgi:protocatechuate 3,4-dioxygenase beta subunit
MFAMSFTRRGLILAAPTLFAIRPVWAATAPTPRAAEGPFYPVEIPTDHDNDLVRIDSMVREAGGEILRLRGVVTDTDAKPIANAVVEIWQCDAHGVYRHPGDPRPNLRDTAFQGFGRTVSDSEGRFNFRTIVPVPYPGRTPHIHAKIIADGRAPLTTQFYLADYRDNARDFLFNRMTSDERKRVSMDIRHQSGNDRAAWETDIVVALPSAG